MFTETWSNESKIKCTNFQHFCLHRERRKNCKRDSSGIIIYIKDTCVNDKSLFFKSEDNILWLRLDIFFLDNDLFIGLCNVVPESSGRFNLQVQNVFDRLLNSVSLIYNYTDGHCNIILSGDFNSRTCDCSDCIDYDLDNDLLLLPDNYVFDISRPRCSQDKGHTSNGTAFVDFCKQTSLRILNHRCAEDADIVKYTFIGSRGCSLVDYVLVSESIFDLISSFTVHDSLSDHCLIDYTFENSVSIGTTYLLREVNIENESYEEVSSKYKWKSERSDSFINAINENV